MENHIRWENLSKNDALMMPCVLARAMKEKNSVSELSVYEAYRHKQIKHLILH